MGGSVQGGGDEARANRSAAVAVRHAFTVPADGATAQRELWQAASDFWAMGEDGDYEESYTLHPDETAARSAYDAEVTRINRAAR